MAYTIRRLTYPKRAHSVWIEKCCPQCNGRFWVIPSRVKDTRHCSKECQKAWMQTHFSHGKCKHCGTDFTYRLRSPEHVQECCSNPCARKYNAGEKHPAWKRDRIKICPQCSKEFPSRVWNAHRNSWATSERVFCSLACRTIHHREHPSKRVHEIGALKRYRDGYMFIKVGQREWKPLHRVVMEMALGRKLAPYEHVHHRNGNKLDNDPENLLVLSRSKHRKIHVDAERMALLYMSGTSGWIHPLEGVAV